MANLNDTYASVLSGYSGSVNDRRSELLTGILAYANPLSLNDMEAAALESLGYTGALNDAWDKYIKALGGFGFSAKADYLSSTFYGNPVPFLFASSQPGAWYDPSDITTLFQDNLGVTPVTAPGQTVGRISDKSGRGNHATQATLAQRPTYGINPIIGTRNLLTYTEQFDNAAWGKTGTSISADVSTSPNGNTTADLLSQTAVTSEHYAEQTGLQTTAGLYTASYYVKAGTVASFQIMVVHIGQAPSTSTGTFAISSGVITKSGNSGIVSNVSSTDVGGGWYRCSISYTLAAGVTSHRTRIYAGLSGSFAGNTANNLLIWGAQLELGSTATTYQKVVSQYEVTQAGVASASYLAFDGVDDSIATPTITPVTDKVQVFAGVRKISDAARANIVEFGNAALNAWFINGPSGSGSDYYFGSAGSISTFTRTVKAAPTTDVLTCIGDIANDIAIIRDNGTQVATSTANQGTGNYSALPLYIGRRGGTTLPFNGRIYSLIVRFGSSLTTGQITSTEKWVNTKTGAY